MLGWLKKLAREMTQKNVMEDPNGKPLETKRRTSTKPKKLFSKLNRQML